ncbi:hypothetical protein Tco_0304457 [Tanacetum coccineum]
MTGNKAYLAQYQEFNGGSITFGGSKGNTTGKGKIKTGKLNFEDVYFVKELKQFNLFYVSQMCDKKNKVLFTDTECLVLSPDFKLPDENQVSNTRPPVKTLFETNKDDELWKNQEDWILKSWTFYENCRVHILLLEDDTKIPMQAEKRYPFAKETIKRMLVLGLTVESVSDVALDLIRIVMKHIEEM